MQGRSSSSSSMPTRFSFEMDETLRSAVNAKIHKNGRRWDEVARLFEGLSGEDCSKRWQMLRSHIGLEYKSFVSDQAESYSSRPSSAETPLIPATKTSPTRKVPQSQQIVIHVCDDAHKVNRDFTCEQRLLVQEMAYFDEYLSGSNSCDDIDISVHCDVNIFDWLMRYVKEEKPATTLDIKNIVSILISSEFLKMDRLVEESVAFFCDNLNEILQLPVDLSCLNSNLLLKLADKLDVEKLDAIEDRKDKLMNKLFMRKLELLLVEPDNHISMCASCSSLFTSRQEQDMKCRKAKLFIDYHGRIVAKHTPSNNWDINQALVNLRSHRHSWSDIFWRFWGLITDMRCSTCESTFSISELGHCSFHPDANPEFDDITHLGTFSCCNATVIRFDTLGRPSGCKARNHLVDTDNCDRKKLDIFMKRRQLIEVPFRCTGDLSELAEIGLVRLQNGASKAEANQGKGGDRGRRRALVGSVDAAAAAAAAASTQAHSIANVNANRQQVISSSSISKAWDDTCIDSSVLTDISDDDDDESYAFDDTEEDDASEADSLLSRAGSSRSMRTRRSRMRKMAPFKSNSSRLQRNISFASKTSNHRRSSSSGSKLARKKQPGSGALAAGDGAGGSRNGGQSRSSSRNRAWKMDSLLDDDRQRMSSLVHTLKGMRKDRKSASASASTRIVAGESDRTSKFFQRHNTGNASKRSGSRQNKI